LENKKQLTTNLKKKMKKKTILILQKKMKMKERNQKSIKKLKKAILQINTRIFC